jgi:hypothetical protein
MEDIVTEEKYSQILALQENINAELREIYESNKHLGREHLSKMLVNEVEKLIDRLNAEGSNFGCADYSGDINYENSEQTYSDGKEMGTGVVLHFRGFSVQAVWEGTDRYYQVDEDA